MAIPRPLLVGLAAMAAISARAPGETAKAVEHGQELASPAVELPRGKERPARPEMTLPELFTDNDYPAAAKRAGEEGSVTFQVDVGRDGRIEACRILVSSGSPLLDATTCRLVRARGRFRPARDARGKPTTDTASGRIHWKL